MADEPKGEDRYWIGEFPNGMRELVWDRWWAYVSPAQRPRHIPLVESHERVLTHLMHLSYAFKHLVEALTNRTIHEPFSMEVVRRLCPPVKGEDVVTTVENAFRDFGNPLGVFPLLMALWDLGPRPRGDA